MIPIIPSQSSEDDRPMGLKFTRNNFFNFPKRDNNDSNTILKRTPSNGHQQQQQQRATPPLMLRKEEPLPQAPLFKRESDLSSTGSFQPSFSPPPVLSPTLPARSPFRIRDSQQQQQHHHPKSHDNILTKSSSSLLDEPPSIYSSVSSSSSTTSSSANTDDDLIQELEGMWKLKTNISQKPLLDEPMKVDINSEDMLIQLLISHAVIDAREYKVLTFEEFEALKQHHARLVNRVKNSKAKLELDKKIQETSHSLSNLSSNKNRESVMLLLDEAVEADRKVKILSQRLHELESEEVDTQYQILQHTAGVLCLGLQKLESVPPTPTTPITPIHHQDDSSRLKSQQQQKVANLRSELETIHSTLNTMLKRYDLNYTQTNSSTDLLQQLERQLENYKSQSKEYELQLASAEERYRIETMSEKKLEIQLKAAQSKHEAAESKHSALQREMNELLAKVNKPMTEDWLPQDDFDFPDDANIKVEALESDLAMARENQQRVERELEKGYEEVRQLKATVADMELASSKIQSQAAVFKSREEALKLEMEKYREEVLRLREEKEKWERTMKRRTIMQVMDGSASSSAAAVEKFEQQLEEQEQEYQAQLKEQAAFLDKTTRQCEQLQQEHDKLASTCQDLELLIRDKSRALDARDVQIQKLESELQQQQQKAANQQQQQPTSHANHELQQLQAQFSEKEAAWIEQSDAMEANFEGILKEFDRLTGTAMEFETDKQNYERRIAQLTDEVKQLEASLTEEKTKNLGYEADTPTTASLRKEFRRMINDMKADHQRTLEREGEEKKRLEKQLKDLKHEREMSRYERTNKGVQTLYMPLSWS